MFKGCIGKELCRNCACVLLFKSCFGKTTLEIIDLGMYVGLCAIIQRLPFE